MIRGIARIVVVVFVLLPSGLSADDQRVVYNTEIDAPVGAVWNAFTTNQGLTSWMAPIATIDLS